MLVFREVLLVNWFDYVNAGWTSKMRVTWEVCSGHEHNPGSSQSCYEDRALALIFCPNITISIYACAVECSAAIIRYAHANNRQVRKNSVQKGRVKHEWAVILSQNGMKLQIIQKVCDIHWEWEWASNIDSQLSKLFCLSECLDFGAGQRGSDNRGWTVLVKFKYDDLNAYSILASF